MLDRICVYCKPDSNILCVYRCRLIHFINVLLSFLVKIQSHHLSRVGDVHGHGTRSARGRLYLDVLEISIAPLLLLSPSVHMNTIFYRWDVPLVLRPLLPQASFFVVIMEDGRKLTEKFKSILFDQLRDNWIRKDTLTEAQARTIIAKMNES